MANAALFVRPAELFPALGNIQVYLYLIIAAIVAGIAGIWNQCRVDTLIQQPINLCMLGFTALDCHVAPHQRRHVAWPPKACSTWSRC
ncbi:MAG: hypothetical protein QM757_10030 [Paludibaculum sp.]